MAKNCFFPWKIEWYNQEVKSIIQSIFIARIQKPPKFNIALPRKKGKNLLFNKQNSQIYLLAEKNFSTFDFELGSTLSYILNKIFPLSKLCPQKFSISKRTFRFGSLYQFDKSWKHWFHPPIYLLNRYCSISFCVFDRKV